LIQDSPGLQRLPAAHRPEALAWWIKRHRKYKLAPPIENLSVFTAQYGLWWGRMTNLEDKGAMCVSGTNGFLSVMLLLRWWGGACMVKPGDTSDGDGNDSGPMERVWSELNPSSEDKVAWSHAVDSAKENLASMLGRQYTRKTSVDCPPTTAPPASRANKRKAATFEDNSDTVGPVSKGICSFKLVGMCWD
jgi:hypothetical protein